MGGAALLTVGIIAVPVVIVGSIYAFNAEARQDLARGVDYVLSGGEGYVWEDAPPAQVAVPDVCTHTVDDILVMAKGGKQKGENYISLRAKEHVQGQGGNPCDILKVWMQEAKANGDKKLQQDIKQAQKFLGCRHHG